MLVARRTLLLAAAVTTLYSAPSQAEVGDVLDGVWQGTLTQVNGPGLEPPRAEWKPFRIVIEHSRVQVFLRNENDERFDEIKPGAFRLSRLGKSALITAIDASSRAPVGQSWVESWSISVTSTGSDTLACVFARQVNNHQMSPDQDGAVFSMLLSGELQRIHIDHV